MKEKNLKKLWSWIWAIVVAVILTMLIRFYLFVPIIVDGVSMLPMLHTNDRVIINRFGKLDRFDVIVFKEEETEYIKRIIGLPGDTVEFKADNLYINGKKYAEPYLNAFKKQIKNGNLTDDYSTKEMFPNGKIPANTYFVLGDNRRASRDSRIIGPIPKTDIIGTVPFSYWPLKNAKLIK